MGGEPFRAVTNCQQRGDRDEKDAGEGHVVSEGAGCAIDRIAGRRCCRRRLVQADKQRAPDAEGEYFEAAGARPRVPEDGPGDQGRGEQKDLLELEESLDAVA